jgi:phospholipase C
MSNPSLCDSIYYIHIYMFHHRLTAFKQNLQSVSVYQTTELKLFNMMTTFILCNVYYKSFLSLKKKKKHTHKPCACLNPNNNIIQ